MAHDLLMTNLRSDKNLSGKMPCRNLVSKEKSFGLEDITGNACILLSFHDNHLKQMGETYSFDVVFDRCIMETNRQTGNVVNLFHFSY